MSQSLLPALPATGSNQQPSNPRACKDPPLDTIIVRFSIHAKQDKVCDRDRPLSPGERLLKLLKWSAFFVRLDDIAVVNFVDFRRDNL